MKKLVFSMSVLFSLLFSLTTWAQFSTNDLENPKPGSFIANLVEQEAGIAANETMSDNVRNLYFKGELFTWYSQLYFSRNYAAFFNSIERVPRIQKLMQIIRTGSSDEKAKLKACVIGMCNFYIKEAPLLPSSQNTDPASVAFNNEPSALFPKDGIAYAYLLSYIDEKGDMLPLLVKMHERQQEASYELGKLMLSKNNSDNVESTPKVFTATIHGAIISYACGHIMRAITINEEKKDSLTEIQKSVLERFVQLEAENQAEWEKDIAENLQNTDEQLEKKRPEWMDMNSQTKILALAKEYVSAI